MKKIYQTNTYSYYFGNDGKTRINALVYLPKIRYLLALQRLYEQVKVVDFVAVDDNTPGCKDTYCSWGFCTNDPKVWPDRQDHYFPEEERCDPLDLSRYHRCPFDKKGKQDLNGCFYKCLFRASFNTEKPNITREEALLLIEKKIKKLEI